MKKLSNTETEVKKKTFIKKCSAKVSMKFKGALSGLTQFLAAESPLKMMK